MRVLLIEDDPTTSKSIEMMLLSEGFNVYCTDMGEEGLDLGRIYDYDIILLDLNLPDIHGYEVLRELRESKVRTPVMVLTGMKEITNVVKALGKGADDYVTKPFSIRELLARIRALLRRAQPPQSVLPDELRFADVVVDFRRYEATKGDTELELTRKEFGVLQLLAARSGEVVTRDELLSEVWGFENYPSTRTVDNHIAGLRAKLEANPAEPRHVLTVHRVGYKFVA